MKEWVGVRQNGLVFDDRIYENLLLDDLKYRLSTLSILELDLKPSHSLNQYNLVIFTYLLGKLINVIGK